MAIKNYNQIQSFGDFLQYISGDQKSGFQVSQKGNQPYAKDLDLFEKFHQTHPSLYGLLGTLSEINEEARVKILYFLLKSSWANCTPSERQTFWKVLEFLHEILPADKILNVYLSLRRDRVNRKHLTRAALRFLFQHENTKELIYFRRRSVQDILEHVLGKSTALTILRIFQKENLEEQEIEYLKHHLFRFVELNKEGRGLFVKAFQARQRGRQPAFYHVGHKKQLEKIFPPKRLSKTISVTHRGDIAANLVHIYRGGNNPQLEEALYNEIEKAVKGLPKFNGKVALVLDASASTRGFGEREFALISQNVAFKLTLEKLVEDLVVIPVGGVGELHFPSGGSDLAMGLIEALEQTPDLVLMVSDGYENRNSGDLEKVVKTLPQLDIQTPVFFVQSQFYYKDDLSQRCPAPSLPELGFWHQDDFENVLVHSFLEASELNTEGLEAFLNEKLSERKQQLNVTT